MPDSKLPQFPDDERAPEGSVNLPSEDGSLESHRGDDSNPTWEANLGRLLQHSYNPPQPSEAFQRRLRATLVERQRKGLGPRLGTFPRTVLAAAALLVVGVVVGFLWLSADGLKVTSPTGFERLTAEAERWQPIPEACRARPGDVLATSATQKFSIEGAHGHEHQSRGPTVVRVTPQPGQLALVRGTLETRGRHSTQPSSLTTPILQVRAGKADFDVAVRQEPPFPAIQTEYLEMNRAKLSAGAAVGIGAVILVTILVHDDSPESVTVETENGGQYVVQAGSKGSFDSQGRAEVASAVAADTTKTESPDPMVARETASPTTTVNGRVVDVRGKPLDEVQVRFFREEESGTRMAVETRTDEQGDFALALETGAVGRIEFQRERYANLSYDWPGSDAAEANQDPAPVEPTDAADATSSEQAESNSSDLLWITLQTETGFAGQVVLEDGATPASSGYVLGYQRFVHGWRWFEPKVRWVESANGSFYVGGLVPGQYKIWVYHEGYHRSAEMMVELEKHQLVDDLRVQLQPGLQIEVSVFDKRSGAPIEDVIVYSHLDHVPGTVNHVERSMVDERVKNAAYTGADGRCTIADLTPGTHHVRVLHSDYMGFEAEIELVEGETPTLEAALEPGSDFYGRVLDKFGQPVTNSAVVAISMVARQELAHITVGVVGDNGDYRIRNQRPGQYVIVRVNAADDEDVKVTMAALRDTQDTEVNFIELAELATVKGRVIDHNGDAMAGMSVSLAAYDSEKGFTFESGLTDADGRFEIRNLKLTEYSVGIGTDFSYSFSIVGQEKLEEPIDYIREYTVYDLKIGGVVLDSEKKPVSNVEVIVLRKSEGGGMDFSGRAVTGPDGRYDIDRMNPGEYNLVATGDGKAPTMSPTFELDAEHKKKFEHEFVLTVGCEITVSVVDAAGLPVPSALIQIFDSEMQVNEGLPPLTNADGNYTWSRLQPGGPYTVKVFKEGWEDAPNQTFSIEVGTPKTLRFELKPTQ